MPLVPSISRHPIATALRNAVRSGDWEVELRRWNTQLGARADALPFPSAPRRSREMPSQVRPRGPADLGDGQGRWFDFHA